MTRGVGRIRVLVIDDQARTADAIARRATDADVELGARLRRAMERRAATRAATPVAGARRDPGSLRRAAVPTRSSSTCASTSRTRTSCPRSGRSAIPAPRRKRVRSGGERAGPPHPRAPAPRRARPARDPDDGLRGHPVRAGGRPASRRRLHLRRRRGVGERGGDPPTRSTRRRRPRVAAGDGTVLLGDRGPRCATSAPRLLSLAPTPMPLLVTGPTGTGKNLLVREVVHPASGPEGPPRGVRLRDGAREPPPGLTLRGGAGRLHGSRRRPGGRVRGRGSRYPLHRRNREPLRGRTEDAPHRAERRPDPSRRRLGGRAPLGARRRGVERAARRTVPPREDSAATCSCG